MVDRDKAQAPGPGLAMLIGGLAWLAAAFWLTLMGTIAGMFSVPAALASWLWASACLVASIAVWSRSAVVRFSVAMVAFAIVCAVAASLLAVGTLGSEMALAISPLALTAGVGTWLTQQRIRAQERSDIPAH